MWYQESFGTRAVHPGQPAHHILYNTIQNNIKEIREAQEKYLKQISDILDIHDLYIEETEEEEND